MFMGRSWRAREAAMQALLPAELIWVFLCHSIWLASLG